MKKTFNQFCAAIAISMILAPTAYGELRIESRIDSPATEPAAANTVTSSTTTPAVPQASEAQSQVAPRKPNRKPAQSENALSRGYDSIEFKLADLAMIKNFGARKEGNDPDSTVVLSGMIPESCLSSIRIEHIIHNSKGYAGFAFLDPTGRGRDCLKENREKKCAGQIKCVALSQVNDARLPLSNEGDIKVGVLHRDPDMDLDSDQWQDLTDKSGATISHVSAGTIRARRLAQAKEAQEAVIKGLRAQLNCRAQSAEDIVMQQTARENLASLGALTDSLAESSSQRIEDEQFDLLSRKITGLDPIKQSEEFEVALEDLRTFVAEHPADPSDKSRKRDAARGAAAILSKKAEALFNSKKPSLESYNKGIALLEEARNLPGQSEESQGKMDALELQAKRSKFERFVQDPRAIADRGFQADFQDYVQDIQSGVQSCATADTSNSDFCGQVQQSQMSAYQVQMIAQRTQQTYQQQQYARMMGYYNMGMGLGMGYNQMMNPMMNPMMMNPYANPYMSNPMMMGGYGGMMGGMGPMMGMNAGMMGGMPMF